MRLSTALILVGLLLIVIPLPIPLAGVIVGTILLLVGLVFRLFGL